MPEREFLKGMTTLTHMVGTLGNSKMMNPGYAEPGLVGLECKRKNYYKVEPVLWL